MCTESQTPPHHPTYNVKLSQARITQIIGVLYPGAKVVQCQQLPRGKSFNNRIYFLDVETDGEESSASTLELVLKLCGHYFGATKVQNEVGALFLLDRLCPTVPSSKIVAWSEDGATATMLRNGEITECNSMDSSAVKGAVTDPGWVLQTRLPGRVLTFEDLDGPQGVSIIRELARHMAEWRTSIPNVASIGSIRLPGNDLETLSQQKLNGAPLPAGLSIGGLILTHKYDPKALTSWLQYYDYQLRDQYEHLMESPELSRLRSQIQGPVSDLLGRLQKLPFLTSTGVRFSHMDFSPRNILISENATDGPIVTGILDFEFSAFLPSQSEFLNGLVNQSDDWPPHHYRDLLEELQRLESEGAASDQPRQSIDVPSTDPPEKTCKALARCICSYHTLRHLSVLESIIGSTAPWWISANSHIGKEQELGEECDKAANIVLGGIKTLSVFWDDTAETSAPL